MANILDGLMGMVTPEMMGTIGNKLDESPSGIESALKGLLPSILGGMVQKAEGGDFGGIFDLIKAKGGDFDLGNLINIIGSGNLAQNDPRDIGGGLLGSLLGSKTGSLIDAVSGMAGINKKSSSSLLGMAAPFIMSFLAKKIKGEKMDAGGLVSMLLGQKSSIMSAIPAVLSSVLGFGGPATNLGAATSNVRETAATTVSTAKSEGGSFLRWLIPLLLLGLLAWFGLRSCGDTDVTASMEDAASSITDAAKDATDAATSMAGDAAATAGSALSGLRETASGLWARALPGGAEIEAAKEGVEYSLIEFIESDKAVDKTTWFNFDALRFATAKADLDSDFSKRQIDNMVAIMKAYPDVNLKIGGYTDSDGAEASNMKLSQSRADNVKAAIVAQGIAASRLDAEGYGEQHPLCPANDTPECKASNRRIAARVSAK